MVRRHVIRRHVVRVTWYGNRCESCVRRRPSRVARASSAAATVACGRTDGRRRSHVVAERVAADVPARAVHRRRQVGVDRLRVAARLVRLAARQPDEAGRHQNAASDRRRTVVTIGHRSVQRRRLRRFRLYTHARRTSGSQSIYTTIKIVKVVGDRRRPWEAACRAWSTHASVSASQQQTLSGRGALVYTCTCVRDNIPCRRLPM